MRRKLIPSRRFGLACIFMHFFYLFWEIMIYDVWGLPAWIWANVLSLVGFFVSYIIYNTFVWSKTLPWRRKK